MSFFRRMLRFVTGVSGEEITPEERADLLFKDVKVRQIIGQAESVNCQLERALKDLRRVQRTL